MIKLLLIMGGLFLVQPVFAQDYSNKGKDFWIAYGNHVRMFETITAQNPAENMELYMTSDINTKGTVEIPGIALNIPFSVTANQITTIAIPRSAGLVNEGIYNLGIHVKAEKPIVVYSFIYVNAISGATLCLPVNTLGREYFSVNFTQVSNNDNSYSYFDVIATDTGITAVEIIPTQNTKGGHQAGVAYVVNLRQGQVYQALGALTSSINPFRGVDLTGSRIRSISTATTKCKKIAVFCGSGKISIGCMGSGTSDNLFQQMYPVSTWGKTYITVPTVNLTSTANQNNYYRIFKSDVSANVKLNGTALPAASFINSQYYEFNTNVTNYIESDKPILVAQYLNTGGCNNSIGQGDPEMIYLNPVEQTISSVTLNSMQPSNTNIVEHHVSVVLKNTPEVIGSFKIDGIAAGKFTRLPSNSNYAYSQIIVSKGTHTLNCDSGFNATAFGFGNAESYGYSAGTNLKDLYQFVSIHNRYTTVNFPAGCKNSPFEFSITFPYKPVKIKWLFKGLFSDTTVNNPLFDSSYLRNGRTLYRYTLKKNYLITATGTYPITLIADNPTLDGCSGEQEIDYDLQIFERPSAFFNISQTGCITDPVTFTDGTNGNGRPVVSWMWNFGDGTKSVLKNPSHTYQASGTNTVSFSSITDIGCLSDTVTKTLVFTASPVAGFKLGAAACANESLQFLDASEPINGVLLKWSWDFGDGAISSTQNPIHVYSSTGTFPVKLSIETITGCKSSFTQSIKVSSLPRSNFSLPEVCLNDPFAAFTDSSVISDNSEHLFTYSWNFGDINTGPANPNSSTVKNPEHKYTAVGIYSVALKVTSKDGCSADTIKKFTVNGAIPKANFEITGSPLCSNRDVTIRDLSTVDFGKITRTEIFWDYANDATNKTVDEHPLTGKTYVHRYQDFGAPSTKSFQVVCIAYSGVTCMQQQVKTIVVQASPLVAFDTILPVCEEVAAFQVSAGREINGLNGTGSYEGRGITAAGIFNPKAAGAGSKTITYLFTATNGCVTEKNQVIEIHPSPLADAGPDRTILENGSLIIAAKGSPNSSYFWTPAIEIDNTSMLTPTVTPKVNTSYQLTVTSANGCSSVDGMMVTLLKEIKVPNAFSPNGDGVNDTWNISHLESYQAATVEVFNRYGKLVFNSTGYGKPWNGTFKGSSLPVGTYYWMINPKNGRNAMNGSVTIIR